MSEDTRTAAPFDVLTVLGIGAVVYLIKNVVHEAVGHGGACLLVGGKAVGLSSAWWDGSYEGVSDWARGFVRAGGTLANLGLGVVKTPTSAPATAEVTLNRSPGWLVAGVAAVLVTIGVLGPAISFAP